MQRYEQRLEWSRKVNQKGRGVEGGKMIRETRNEEMEEETV